MILTFSLIATLAGPAAAQGPAQPARRTVALLDYVAGDYARAVGPGGEVISAAEHAEQVGFVEDAARELRADTGTKGEDLAGRIDRLAQAVAARALPAVVTAEAHALREEVAQRFGVVILPSRAPDVPHGKQIFEQACAACHGVTGHPDLRLGLSTRPPAFASPDEVKTLSPQRAFSVITYGVGGTAMPAWDEAFDDASRWDVAFYLLTLSKGPAAADGLALARAALVPTAYTELAALSDAQLQERLSGAGLGPAQRAGVLAAIRAGPFAGPRETMGEKGLAEVRRGVREALGLAQAGDRAGARRALVSAYLDQLEPHEAALRARDGRLVQQIEAEFLGLRNAIENPAGAREPAGVAAARLESLLEKADASRQGGGLVAFVAALAIALREGVEAALLVAAMLALLRKAGRERDARAVHLGWTSALALGAVTWWASGALLVRLSGAQREWTEALFQLATAGLLLWASHWLLAALSAKKLVAFLSARTLAAGSALVILGLTFVAVFREMFETVLFFRGLLLESPGSGAAVALGAAVGLCSLALLVALFQRLGRRLKPRPLLVTCGLLLCALAVVMVGHGVRSLQILGMIPLTVWGTFEQPALGLYATREGVLAQAAVLTGLVLSALASARADRVARTPGATVAS